VYSTVTTGEDIRTACTAYRIIEHDCLEKVVWLEVKVKVKVTLEQATKAQTGRGIALTEVYYSE
jgi:hypothetical protein